MISRKLHGHPQHTIRCKPDHMDMFLMDMFHKDMFLTRYVYEFQIRCPCVLKEHKIISFAKMVHLLYDLISCTSLAGINIRMLFLYE